MKRADVQISYHQGRSYSRDPMVNVKVRNTPYTPDGWATLARQIAADAGADAPEVESFARYVVALWEQEARLLGDTAWEIAIEQGWEALQRDAEECFGPGVKVYSEGRQGGWCVVEGLGDVEAWDAVALGKWARFSKWARGQADGVPYAMVDFLYHNPWTVQREGQDAAREWIESRAVGV